MDDESAASTEGCKGSSYEKDAAGSEDANDLVACLGGIGERAAEVEDGAEAEGATEGAEDLYGGMVEGGIEEHEVGFAKTLGGEFRGEFDGNAEGFKYVGGSAAGGDGAVAMLGDLGSCGSGNEGCAGRDIEGKRTAAAGADNVDELGAFVIAEGHGCGSLAHDLNEAG